MADPPRPRPWGRMATGLVLIELLASWLDLRLGPFARVHWEERFNARSGVQFACGHVAKAFELQYRTFCGGCTAEGLMAAPLFSVFGPTQLVWKMVPEFFHAVVVILGTVLAGQAAGGRAALAFAALMLGAPGFYRELAHTGWGNHAESTAFPLAALALLLLAASLGRWWQRLSLAVLAGAVSGLGFWFAYTSAHMLPAVLIAAVLVLRWQAPVFVLGFPLGVWPWWFYHRSRDQALDFAKTWMPAVHPSPSGPWMDWLWGGYLRHGLWDSADYGPPGWLPGAWWFLLWGVAVLGIVAAGFSWRRSQRQGRAALLAAPLGLTVLLVIYALRYDLWSNLPDPYTNAAFNLRYRAPLWPMLALCAAPVATLSYRGRRWPFVTALSLLVGFGLVQRLSLWQQWRRSYADLRVYVHDGWADVTVPSGQPRVSLRREQGRAVDIEAALNYLNRHQDPLPECRWSHVFELGRRLGMGLNLDPKRGDLGESLELAVSMSRGDPTKRRFVAFGIAKALDPKGQLRRADLGAVLDRLRPSGLDEAVGRELGKLGWEQPWIKDEPVAPDWLDARVWAGVCAGRGAHIVDLRTKRGSVRPGPVENWHPGRCPEHPGYWHGIGTAWAEYVGCTKPDGALLARESGAFLDAAWQGFDAGCREYRVRPAPSP